VQARIQLLGEVVGRLGFLLVADDALTVADDGLAVVVRDLAGTQAVLDTALDGLAEWVAAGLEEALGWCPPGNGFGLWAGDL
jgi:hypothetical protein